VRALAVLEALGTKEALAAIEKLAAGAPGAQLTLEAGAAAERLKP